MADDKKKPAMSLNQLHSRLLSTSQARPKQKPVAADDDIPRFDLDSRSPSARGEVDEKEPASRLNDSSPRLFSGFDDFDSPSDTLGDVDVKEPASRLNDSSPRLFPGFDDFDSPSDTLASKLPQSSKIAEEEDSFSKKNPATSESGEVDDNEPTSRLNNSTPRLFSGFDDFNSPPDTLASKPPQSSKIAEEEDSFSKKNPATSDSGKHNTDVPVAVDLNDIEPASSKISAEVSAEKGKFSLSGVADNSNVTREEEKQKKVRIEGRRRLCKISEANEDNAGAGENVIKPYVEDDIWDFDSPLQVKKTCAGSGNEILDVLNDLTSKLEILSIEKKRIPKKVDIMDEFWDSLESKLHDVAITEGSHDYKASGSSHLPFSYSREETAKPKGAGSSTNKYQKKKTYGVDAVADRYDGKTSRNMDKYESLMNNEPMRVHQKPVSTKEFEDYSYRKEDEDYVTLSERPHHKKLGGQKKFIEASDEEFDEITVSENHVDEFTMSDPRGKYKLPGKIAKMLYPHQREGLKWLWSLHTRGKGGILGDDMGLGKTMQICSYLCGLFNSNLIRRVLIVAPKTLLTHWTNELSTVGLSDKTREYFSTCQKLRHYELQYVLQDKGILLTTYDIVRNNTKALCGDHRYNDDGEEDEFTWDYMILDEGHLIKNPSTQRAKSLLQIPCRHRIIISGTPLQNNLKELWALFNFCCPELLGDKKDFKDKYEHFINRGMEKNASDREKHIGSSVAKKLRDCIEPYFLRRMKSEVFRDDATLSNKNELIVWLRLTQCQRRLYEAFLNSEIVVSACDGSPLAALTILKKICDHPLILTKRAAEDLLEGMDSMAEQEDHRVAEKLAKHIADVAERFDAVESHDISCKISFILSLLGDLIPKGHNVLIFSQTKKMLNLIQESLTSNHYKYMRIDGTTKVQDRAKVVKDFQEGRGAPIFLLTSQVGGLGLTLTNADRVIVVDPAWNPSTDNQSVDRAYRIGQKKDVIVYRLMTCGTVEEKIYRKQVFKGGLFRTATEHKEQIRYFSQQDLKDLFTLPKLGFDISPTQQQLLEEHDREHTMEESIRAHVEFLETLNIAGVSQHSLLFSKAAPAQEVEILDEPERPRGTSYSYMGNASSRSSLERNVDGSQYAFNPKDVNKVQRQSSSPDVSEPSEAEIKDRIDRLSQIFSNMGAVSRLPDKGEKIHKQIAALNVQLHKVRLAKGSKDNAIELS